MNLEPGKKYIFAVSHLPALLGKPHYKGQEGINAQALQETADMKRAGLTGILLENENDHPYSILATTDQRSSMTIAAKAVKKDHFDFNLGVEFLINDPMASLEVAFDSGCQFMRTDYWVDKMHREEYGDLEVDTEEFNRFKKKLGAQSVQVFADIQVKYATMREEKSITTSALQAFEAGASAVVVSGSQTGEMSDLRDLEKVRAAVGDRMIFVGSGFSVENARETLSLADGALVGTSLMENSVLNYERASKLMEVVHSI
ncbi:MAG: membrane complex biogenesis BtpA family protein [Bacteriovoracaceae bacterium]|jgi:membrane complex biogenesis BtpA family protein